MKADELKTKICPVCGRSSNKVEFIGFFCIDDYMSEKKLKLPKEIKISVCKRCDKVAVRETEWKESIIQLKDGITSQLKGPGIEEIRILKTGLREIEVEFLFWKSKIKRTVPVLQRRTLCDVHTKMARGYYEATIQLRGDFNRIEKAARHLMELLNKISFVTAFNEFKYGVDIMVGSNEAVRKAVSKLGLKAVVTRKVWGAKAGETIYRVTYLIKL